MISVNGVTQASPRRAWPALGWVAGLVTLLVRCVIAVPAGAQGGWTLLVPPIDEAKIKALREDRDLRVLSPEAAGFIIRRLAVNEEAPLSEWLPLATHASLGASQEAKERELEARLETILEFRRGEVPLSPRAEGVLWDALTAYDRARAARCVPASVEER